jgi:hypothetical protein
VTPPQKKVLSASEKQECSASSKEVLYVSSNKVLSISEKEVLSASGKQVVSVLEQPAVSVSEREHAGRVDESQPLHMAQSWRLSQSVTRLSWWSTANANQAILSLLAKPYSEQ